MTDSQCLADWFEGLKPATKARLVRDPYGPVPDEFIADVTRPGRLQFVIGSYRVGSAKRGVVSFYLGDAAQDWIHEHYRQT